VVFLRVFLVCLYHHLSIIPPCSILILLSSFIWPNSPHWVKDSSFRRILDHTQRRTTVGRTPLDEWSARRSDLYLATHNTDDRQTSMLSMGFELTVSAGELPQTYSLDRAAGRTDLLSFGWCNLPINGCSFKGLSPAAPQLSKKLRTNIVE